MRYLFFLLSALLCAQCACSHRHSTSAMAETSVQRSCAASSASALLAVYGSCESVQWSIDSFEIVLPDNHGHIAGTGNMATLLRGAGLKAKSVKVDSAFVAMADTGNVQASDSLAAKSRTKHASARSGPQRPKLMVIALVSAFLALWLMRKKPS